MSRSNVIFGTIIFAFLVYITMKGQLPSYIGLFKPKPKETVASSKESTTDKVGKIASTAGKIAAAAAKIAAFF